MMEKHFRLLDCTLRDGGHIVQGKFGESTIKGTIEYLIDAGIDIIEVGFLWDKTYDTNTTRYYTIEDVKRILPHDRRNSKFSLMADFIDLTHIEPYDGTIEYIRLSFKRWRLDWGLKTAKILMDKGYKVFINPVNNNVYSDKQYIEVIEKVNELHPYGFSIVDTFGVMRISDLSHRYYLVENNLNPDITIGVHLHENLGLAYSLAQHIIQIANPQRKIVIDGSLLGMGRVPGNLCIEQIIDYFNDQHGTHYAIEPIYDAIDDYIAPIKEQNPWGYAIPYALSAKFYLHRTYAEYLIGKNRLKTKDIQRILSRVSENEAETYNEKYIETLYRNYMDVKYDDFYDLKRFKMEISKFSNILLIAPGQSITKDTKKIKKFISSNCCIISINFNSDIIGINPSYIFLTNTKRYDAIKHGELSCKLIITSNLIRDIKNSDFIISYNESVNFNDLFCDDSVLMFLNLLLRIGIKKVTLAGFDGQHNGTLAFFDDSFDRGKINSTNGVKVKDILKSNFQNFNLIFLTESEYDK